MRSQIISRPCLASFVLLLAGCSTAPASDSAADGAGRVDLAGGARADSGGATALLARPAGDGAAPDARRADDGAAPDARPAGDGAAPDARRAGTTLAEKDLAILFDKTRPDILKATATLPGGGAALPAAWYDDLLSAYAGTTFVKDALQKENSLDEWSNVSARFEPCAPLGVAPFQASDALCWPQVRLVWQPLKRSISFGSSAAGVVTSENYPDDRAIHVLYDVDPAAVLPAADATAARSFLERVRAFANAGAWRPSGPRPLSPDEAARFERLRDAAVRELVGDVVALRDPSVAPAAYAGLGLRPELRRAGARGQFMAKWGAFLVKYARPSALTQLTSFSLEQNRDADRWAGNFVSLRPAAGRLVATAEPIYSPTDGSRVVDVPRDDIVSGSVVGLPGIAATDSPPTLDPAQCFSAAECFDLSVAAATNPAAVTELLGNALLLDPKTFFGPSLGSAKYASITSRARARAQTLVSNTTCMTCHQLDARAATAPLEAALSPVNFHNLSYFSAVQRSSGAVADVGFTVSSRVASDVAFDLGWLAAHSR
jgi:hypothetical protein